MGICPNDKFIEIFTQRFHYFEDPFDKVFALNLLFQDTSFSLALKYSSFLFKFFSFALYINFWFKISKICPKISHFSQISHSRAVVLKLGSAVLLGFARQIFWDRQAPSKKIKTTILKKKFCVKLSFQATFLPINLTNTICHETLQAT